MPCVQPPNQHSAINIDKPSTSQQSENVQPIPIQEITDLQRNTHTSASLSTSTDNQNRSTTSTSNTMTIPQVEHNQPVDDNPVESDNESNNTENSEKNQGIFLQLPAINSCHHFIH